MFTLLTCFTLLIHIHFKFLWRGSLVWINVIDLLLLTFWCIFQLGALVAANNIYYTLGNNLYALLFQNMTSFWFCVSMQSAVMNFLMITSVLSLILSIPWRNSLFSTVWKMLWNPASIKMVAIALTLLSELFKSRP